MRFITTIFAVILSATNIFAQNSTPLYIVNGVPLESVSHIPTSDIEDIISLNADEETIARYGEQANNGVIIITLRYDTPAQFTGGGSFNDYIADHTKWDNTNPSAKVVMRYTIDEDGSLKPGEILECTDYRLKKKVISAMKKAPSWIAAQKNGKNIDSQYVLSIQLPKGVPIPAEPYIVIL